MILRDAERVTEALVMNDLTGAQETDRVLHVRVVAQAQNVVIRHAGFLLRGEILIEVCERIPP